MVPEMKKYALYVSSNIIRVRIFLIFQFMFFVKT